MPQLKITCPHCYTGVSLQWKSAERTGRLNRRKPATSKDAFNALSFHGTVESNPQVMSGVPVISGTRMPAATVIANVAGGMNLYEVSDDLGLDLGTLQDMFRGIAAALDAPAAAPKACHE